MTSTIRPYARLCSIVCFIGLLRQAAPAQDFIIAQSRTEERPRGLLAIPEIYGEFPCMLFEAKTLDLYATPSKDRPPIAVIERLNPPRPPERPDCDFPQVVVRKPFEISGGEPLPMDESGYEMFKAVVYEQSGRWFRIAVPRGSAWIERENAEGLMAYPEDLAIEGISTYLRENWGGHIWIAPGDDGPVPAPAGWRAHANEEIPIRVISTQVVRGEKWIRVRFQSESCGQSFGNLPPLEGWFPAYQSSRATTVWFYSRGC